MDVWQVQWSRNQTDYTKIVLMNSHWYSTSLNTKWISHSQIMHQMKWASLLITSLIIPLISSLFWRISCLHFLRNSTIFTTQVNLAILYQILLHNGAMRSPAQRYDLASYLLHVHSVLFTKSFEGFIALNSSSLFSNYALGAITCFKKISAIYCLIRCRMRAIDSYRLKNQSGLLSLGGLAPATWSYCSSLSGLSRQLFSPDGNFPKSGFKPHSFEEM